ncbi:hypothetical protein BSL78_06252, partial [Apostichopus japonicus]
TETNTEIVNMAVSSPDDSDSLRYDSDDISIGGDDSKISNLFNFVRDISKNNKLSDHVEILVSEHEKRSETGSMGMKDVFTTYLIEVRIREENGRKRQVAGNPSSLWRRYSEFEMLRNYLVVTFPYVIVPPLPEKRMTIMWQQMSTVDHFDADFIERRRVGLETFLQRVASHEEMGRDHLFHTFMLQDENWRETIVGTGFQSKQDSRLKNLNASFRLKKPDKRFEGLKIYAQELRNNISAILKTRAKLAGTLYGIHKIHGNYGRVFSEWSGIEKEMGDGLQSAGHFMDAYKDYIDDFMNEEEQISDQLKEYIYFADSLKAVCRKQEVMQYELEKSEELLSSKRYQRDQLLGKAPSKTLSLQGMRSKIFGPEKPEVKDARLRQLEDQIEEAEEAVLRNQSETMSFMEHALSEVERFKKQKGSDLKELFISYAVLQIKMAKR